MNKVPRCTRSGCMSLVKPDVVFFGEDLPRKFYYYLRDFPLADLLIVMGTSLEVSFYRPQTKLAKVIFSEVSVCPRGRFASGHGGVSATHPLSVQGAVSTSGPGGCLPLVRGECLPPPGHPPGQTSPRQTPPGQTPPWADTPGQTPARQTSPWQTPPQQTPKAVHAGIHIPPSACWDTVNELAVRIPLDCIPLGNQSLLKL